MTVCQPFRRRAFATWDLLVQASRVRTTLVEETLPDLNLLEFRVRHPKEIVTHRFSKPAEGVEGADWEWWLTGTSGRWLAIRIQAKVIDVLSSTFPHLHYRRHSSASSAPFQSELLIRKALTATPP